jgi:hypothetical protein
MADHGFTTSFARNRTPAEAAGAIRLVVGSYFNFTQDETVRG